MLKRGMEGLLFASRWLLAPFYLALIGSLGLLLLKTGQHAVTVASQAWSASEAQVILEILGLIEVSLTASLIVIVIFSGYENFISKITSSDPDWPQWMAQVDFSGLKLKLVSSIVAITAVQLLRDFLDLKNISDREIYETIAVLLCFVVTGLLLALTDRIDAGAPSDPR